MGENHAFLQLCAGADSHAISVEAHLARGAVGVLAAVIEVADASFALQVLMKGYLGAGLAFGVTDALGHADVGQDVARQSGTAGQGIPGAVFGLLIADALALVGAVADYIFLPAVGDRAQTIVIDAAVVAFPVPAAIQAWVAVAVIMASDVGIRHAFVVNAELDQRAVAEVAAFVAEAVGAAVPVRKALGIGETGIEHAAAVDVAEVPLLTHAVVGQAGAFESGVDTDVGCAVDPVVAVHRNTGRAGGVNACLLAVAVDSIVTVHRDACRAGVVRTGLRAVAVDPVVAVSVGAALVALRITAANLTRTALIGGAAFVALFVGTHIPAVGAFRSGPVALAG
jgi:hypothetical protein